MIFLAIVLGAIADMVWGGQAARFSSAIHKFRRVIGPSLFVFGLVFVIGLYPALISGLGYTLTRMMGWRFKPAGNELFLHMEKPKHYLFAFIYGLALCVIPVVYHVAIGADLMSGLLFWVAVAAILPLPWAAVLAVSRKTGNDLLPLKEVVWGAMIAGASIMYFAHSYTSALEGWIYP